MDFTNYGLEEWAALFEGRSKRTLVSKEEEAALEESGFVVVWGESDDLLECRGSIHDEFDTYEGKSVYINAPENECDDECCPYHKAEFEKFKRSEDSIRVDAYWYGKLNDNMRKPEHAETEWYFESDRLSRAFKIVDEREPDCVNFGLVIDNRPNLPR